MCIVKKGRHELKDQESGQEGNSWKYLFWKTGVIREKVGWQFGNG